MTRIYCVHCGKEIDENYRDFCPHCGKEQPVMGQGSGNQDNHIENHYNRDMSVHDNRNMSTNDNRDMSTHNTSNVTNHTTNVINIQGGSDIESLTPEQQEELYYNERILLEKSLKEAKDETVFAYETAKIDSQEKSKEINRLEASRRRILVQKYQKEFTNKRQQATASVRPAPVSDQYLSRESARSIGQNVRVQPTAEPTSSNSSSRSTSSDESKGGVLKGCLVLVVVAVLVIWGFRSCIGCSGSDETNQEDSLRTELTDDVRAEEEGTNSENTKSKKKTKVERGTTSTSTTSSEEPTKDKTYKQEAPTEATTPTPSTSSAAAEVTTATPSELVSRGTKAIRKMDYDTAVQLLKQAADKGSTEAYYHLGLLYSNNNYDRANRQTAINYFTMAARAGNTNAMYELGNLYSGRDNAQARSWYEQAAERGHKKAASRLQ